MINLKLFINFTYEVYTVNDFYIDVLTKSNLLFH